LSNITEWTGAAITPRGQFFPQGKHPAPGERKLFLHIEGATETSVKQAKTEIKKMLDEVNTTYTSGTISTYAKYSVL